MKKKKYKGKYTLQIFWFVFLLIILLPACSTSHYTFNQKYPAPELKEDVIILKKVLEANHPSLYWYTPKDSIDYYFDKVINSIKDSLTEVQFHNKVSRAVSKIRCGHTAVRFSKKYNKQFAQHWYPVFPLYLKTWKDSLVVVLNDFSKDPVFTRGTIITSINGISNKTILDSIFQFICADGYSGNYKSQVVSGSFPIWYKTIFGLDSSYHITYINPAGEEKTATIKNFTPQIDTAKKKGPASETKQTHRLTHHRLRQIRLQGKRAMYIDTSINSAYIRLATFSGNRLRKFFRQSFRKIHQEQIKNVVIDLRENGGGNIDKSILLTKYLKDSSFKLADTVAAISRKFKYRRYIRQWWLYWFPMHFAARKMSDGRIHDHRFETHYFRPKLQYHFDGHLYLIQGGYTFSAASMFTASMKGQKNVTIVGEESGGGYYGNSAMHLPEIKLPYSKIRVVLPMYRLVMNHNRKKDGRGVIPDIQLEPSSEAIKKGVDPKMKTIREMILAGSGGPVQLN